AALGRNLLDHRADARCRRGDLVVPEPQSGGCAQLEQSQSTPNAQRPIPKITELFGSWELEVGSFGLAGYPEARLILRRTAEPLDLHTHSSHRIEREQPLIAVECHHVREHAAEGERLGRLA